MAQLKLVFMNDGGLSIFNPETHESMEVDKDQTFQLYDSIQLNYYKEEVRDNINYAMENGSLDPTVAMSMVVDSEYITQIAGDYQSALRKSQTICEAEHELLEDTVNDAVGRDNDLDDLRLHDRFRYPKLR